MEVEIISTECIRPSSSTPHLKTFKFSILDQFMAPMFYSTALFYPNATKTNISQRSLVLKHSLSKTLSHFYPLAGKIKDYLSIDCNDEGVHYTEAKANISMVEYLTQPDLTLLAKLVPRVSHSLRENPTGAFVVMVQETTFVCGGLVIGLSVSHMALDGTALASFIKAWASTASSSGNKEMTHPNLDAQSLFLQCDPFPKEALFTSLFSPFIKKGKIAARRLMFDASAINKLKANAASSNISNPSRTEVVSAIIGKSVRAASNAKSIAVNHAVNIRRKTMPPFPDSSLGNFVWLAPTVLEEKESQLSELVYKIRNAIRKVDNDFVKEIGSFKLFKEAKETESKLSQGEDLMLFSSWCNFGLYNNSDFGWEKPIWIANCTIIDSHEITFNNVTLINETRSGNGVEAWVYVPQDVAAALDKDDELLQYASINPSPLSIT